ncbi:hypothetical protein QDZ90_005788, partial [Pluralibacter gergoviae]|nr:hypothetical protein [Pluralibacter gergoviae]
GAIEKMKITLKDKVDDRLIRFESDIGGGVAVWEGDPFSPNTSYNVELEIDDLFEIGRNIFLEKKCINGIDFINGELFFKAKVISYEEDGVLVLSLEKDIIFIEASGANEIDGYVSFFTKPDKVSLYPIEL